MPDLPAFSSWVKQRRKALDMTQAQLALQVPCAPVTLRKIEAGVLRPSRELSARLVQLLAATPDEYPDVLRSARQASPQPAPRQPALPVPLSTLIGRAQEVDQLCSMIQRGARLVCLTGPGGVGKTRLALAVAHRVQEAFPHGACFVDMAPLAEPQLVASAILEALDVAPGPEWEPVDQLAHALAGRHALLVLDNFEHLLDAAPLITALLRRAPNLVILVTSRVALRLDGEHRFVVPPLAVPDLAHLPGLVTLAQCPAVALFLARAAAAATPVVVTEANAASLAAVCAQLDGLPLAIELAAARAALLTPEMLRDRLAQDGALRALGVGRRDAAARHQTLRATLAWSYDLLEPDDRRLFCHLAVFTGGWTLAAAEQVCGDREGPGTSARHNVADRLAVLIASSLVVRATDADGVVRFTMLETVREYARELLATSGEEDTLRQRHLCSCVDLATAAYTDQVDMSREGLRALDAERDNLRAALAWSLRPVGQPELGLRLAAHLGQWWFRRGHDDESHRWLAQFLEHPILADASTEDAARARYWSGKHAMMRCDHRLAVQRFAESLAAYVALDDPLNAARLRHELARVAREQTDYARAAALNQEALEYLGAHDPTYFVADVLLTFGDIATDQGQLSVAAEYLQESLALSRQLGYHVGVGASLMNLGRVMCLAGDLPQARAYAEASLALAWQEGYPTLAGKVQVQLARIERAAGDNAGVARHCVEAITTLREIGIGAIEIAICQELLAGMAAASGQDADAVQLFSAAAAVREVVDDPIRPVDRAEYDRDLAAVQAHLTESAFAAAWAGGRRLGREETVRLASDIAAQHMAQLDHDACH
ncbi:MAG: hypothetical protein RLZZ387_5068 [Chloroflexota bacterium]